VKYLTRKQATEYLRERDVTVGKGLTVHPVSDGYLRSVAAAGTGPQFRYLGLHPVYTKEDLDAWIEARRGSRLEAFLQHKRLPLGPLTRTSRTRGPRRRRKQPASDSTAQSLPP
jgi:hypothetical protein